MIGKVTGGADTAGLLGYLLGPGRATEHTDPHLVAAWDPGVVVTAASAPPDRASTRHLAALLDHPLAALAWRPTRTVWHCSLRTAPGDRHLTDAQWADIAAGVLDRTGLAPRDDPDGCRWVAVRHAADHIHLAVTLARQDGRAARTSHDWARVAAACRDAELAHGLTRVPPRDPAAPRRPSRAEVEMARRRGWVEVPRQTLRREVRRAALASSDVDGFVEQLHRRGVLVRLRPSETDPSVVAGYAVATSAHRTSAGGVVWYGGGTLAPQLSLPRLEQSWRQTPPGVPTAERGLRAVRGQRPQVPPAAVLGEASAVSHRDHGRAARAAAALARAVPPHGRADGAR